MPFPESTRVVYQHNPLAQVITQLQFPPILTIGSGDPAEFQERIRHKFPLYRRETTVGIPPELVNALKQMNVEPPNFPSGQHTFTSADERASIVLTRDFLAIEHRAYRNWETFSDDVKLTRDALEAVYHPAFYSRVGLRYVNVIDRSVLGLAGEPWTALVNERLVGILSDSRIEPDVSELTSAVVIGLSDPSGSSVTLRTGLRKTGDSPERHVYVVDADFSTTERTTPDAVTDRLTRFNRGNGNLFRWAITSRLSNALGRDVG